MDHHGDQRTPATLRDRKIISSLIRPNRGPRRRLTGSRSLFPALNFQSNNKKKKSNGLKHHRLKITQTRHYQNGPISAGVCQKNCPDPLTSENRCQPVQDIYYTNKNKHKREPPGYEDSLDLTSLSRCGGVPVFWLRREAWWVVAALVWGREGVARVHGGSSAICQPCSTGRDDKYEKLR